MNFDYPLTDTFGEDLVWSDYDEIYDLVDGENVPEYWNLDDEPVDAPVEERHASANERYADARRQKKLAQNLVNAKALLEVDEFVVESVDESADEYDYAHTYVEKSVNESAVESDEDKSMDEDKSVDKDKSVDEDMMDKDMMDEDMVDEDKSVIESTDELVNESMVESAVVFLKTQKRRGRPRKVIKKEVSDVVDETIEEVSDVVDETIEKEKNAPKSTYEMKQFIPSRKKTGPSHMTKWEACEILHSNGDVSTVRCNGLIYHSVAKHFLRSIFDPGRHIMVEYEDSDHEALVLGTVSEHNNGLEKVLHRLKKDKCNTSPGILVEYGDASVEIIPWESIDTRILKKRRII